MRHTAWNMTTTLLTGGDLIMENRMDISHFAVTGEGGRVYNEDYYGHVCHGDAITFVVSDGVGGQDGGSMASSIVVELVKQQAKSLDRTEM